MRNVKSPFHDHLPWQQTQWNYSKHPSLDTIPFPCTCPWPLLATGQGNCGCFPYAAGPRDSVHITDMAGSWGGAIPHLVGVWQKRPGESCEWKLWTRVVVLSCSTVQEQKPFYSLFLKLSTESEVNSWPPTKVQGVLCKFQAPLLSVERLF